MGGGAGGRDAVRVATLNELRGGSAWSRGEIAAELGAFTRQGSDVSLWMPPTGWRSALGDETVRIDQEDVPEGESRLRFGYIDKAGEMTVPATLERAGDFADGLAAARQGGRVGYLDVEGKWVIEPQFRAAETFSEKLAAASDGTRIGYIDPVGKWVIPPSFDAAWPFHDGVAKVKIGDLTTYVTRDNQLLWGASE